MPPPAVLPPVIRVLSGLITVQCTSRHSWQHHSTCAYFQLNNMELDLIIIVSVFSAAWFVTLVMVLVLFSQVSELRKKVTELQGTGRMRVQKLKIENDKNHAFHNPSLVPDEELSRRGYSMYIGADSDRDIESMRAVERQTGGQLFVEDLTRELENRQHRNSHYQTAPQPAPPFLLQSIQENKRKSRNLANPVANGRQSDTNPNFIY